MDKTPKYRWNRIAAAGVYGCCAGFLLLLLLGLGCFIISCEFPNFPEPPDWLAWIFGFGFFGLPIWGAIFFIYAEVHGEATEYRLGSNQRVQCGYSLHGLRRIRDRCPECGTTFRRLQ